MLTVLSPLPLLDLCEFLVNQCFTKLTIAIKFEFNIYKPYAQNCGLSRIPPLASSPFLSHNVCGCPSRKSIHLTNIRFLLVLDLFHRAIMMSGSAFSDWAMVEDPVHYAVKLASSLNCSIPR